MPWPCETTRFRKVDRTFDQDLFRHCHSTVVHGQSFGCRVLSVLCTARLSKALWGRRTDEVKRQGDARFGFEGLCRILGKRNLVKVRGLLSSSSVRVRIQRRYRIRFLRIGHSYFRKATYIFGLEFVLLPLKVSGDSSRLDRQKFHKQDCQLTPIRGSMAKIIGPR